MIVQPLHNTYRNYYTHGQYIFACSKHPRKGYAYLHTSNFKAERVFLSHNHTLLLGFLPINQVHVSGNVSVGRMIGISSRICGNDSQE